MMGMDMRMGIANPNITWFQVSILVNRHVNVTDGRHDAYVPRVPSRVGMFVYENSGLGAC